MKHTSALKEDRPNRSRPDRHPDCATAGARHKREPTKTIQRACCHRLVAAKRPAPFPRTQGRDLPRAGAAGSSFLTGLGDLSRHSHPSRVRSGPRERSCLTTSRAGAASLTRSTSYHRNMRRTKRTVMRSKATSLKARRLKPRDQEGVKGGIVKTPSPGGPIPIPYPTVSKKEP